MNIPTHCQGCGSTNLKEIPTPNLTHHAKIECQSCKRHIKWVKNPQTKGRTQTSTYTIENIARHKEYDKPFCFLCLRIKNQLGIKETLTIDHIQELQEGGQDTINNIQILCSACHKLKNWTRLYLNWHLRGKQ